jgi:hypothetical protein
MNNEEFYNKVFDGVIVDLSKIQDLLLNFDWSSIDGHNFYQKQKEFDKILPELILTKHNLEKRLDGLMMVVHRQHLWLARGTNAPIFVKEEQHV